MIDETKVTKGQKHKEPESSSEEMHEHKMRKHEEEYAISQTVMSEYAIVKPFFRKHFQNFIEAEIGSSIRMEAFLEPKNDHSMEIYLFKNGQILSSTPKVNILYDSGYISVCIRELNFDDCGAYKCIAKNPHGTCETNLNLSVIPAISKYLPQPPPQSQPLQQKQLYQETVHKEVIQTKTTEKIAESSRMGMAPIFRIPLHIPPLFFSEGEQVYMEAFIEPVNDPYLTIEWFHNRKPVVFTQRHQCKFDYGRISLRIQSVTIEDKGEYTVVAKNQFGQAESSATVEIVKMSDIKPSSFEAAQEISTYREEELYENKENLDRFYYEKQKTRREFEDVPETFSKPMFLTKMNSVRVEEGKTACLESRIEPALDPSLTIDWFFEDKPLKVGNRFQPYYHFGFVVLKILKTQPDDTGLYTCRISNQLGSAEMSASIICIEEVDIIEERVVDYSRSVTTKKETTEFDLKPQAPKFLRDLNDVEVIEGQKVHLESYLKPSDDPDLVVEWFKNNIALQKGSRYIEICDFGYVGLDILYVYPEDSGMYTVKATNKYGTASTSCIVRCMGTANLDTSTQNEICYESISRLESKKEKRVDQEIRITEPPKFLQPLKSANKIENESAHFETQLSPMGDESLSIEWYHNNYPLQCSSRISTLFNFGYVSLDIKNLQPSDSGIYTCRAVNRNGQATIAAMLNVSSTKTVLDETAFPESLEKISIFETKTFKRKEFEDDMVGSTKPVIIKQLQGTTNLEEGACSHFQCLVEPTRDETMTVEWFHNGNPLSVGSRYRTLFDFGYIALDIFKVTSEDSGIYKVKISNHLGSVQSEIQLNVIGRENIIRTSNQPSSLDKIQYLERTHKKKRVEEDVHVQEKPRFGVQLKSCAVHEGDPFSLKSTLTPLNDPTMKVEWYHNGQLLKIGHRFKSLYDFGYVTLDILYAYSEDSGVYECRAVNHLGEAVITCNIQVIERKTIDTSTIHDESLIRIRQIEQTKHSKRETQIFETTKPVFSKKLKSNYELKEGQSVLLECILEPVHDSTMVVEWYHNNVPIKTGHRFVVINEFGYVALKILYVYSEDSGSYYVRYALKIT